MPKLSVQKYLSEYNVKPHIAHLMGVSMLNFYGLNRSLKRGKSVSMKTKQKLFEAINKTEGGIYIFSDLDFSPI